MPLEIFAEERHIREIQRIGDVVDRKVGRFQLCLCIHDHHRGDDLDTSLVGRLLDNRTEMRRSYAEFLGMKQYRSVARLRYKYAILHEKCRDNKNGLPQSFHQDSKSHKFLRDGRL